MSHTIHQSPAIILKGKNMRESNKLLILYTQKFGLIYVVSQSLREAKSKMKFHTLALSYVDVDVVEGRDIWRLTGIHEHISSMAFAGTSWFEMLRRVASLIIRLCPGEEENSALFSDLSSLYAHLATGSLDEKHLVIYEIITVCRILYHLGYWEGDEDFITERELFSSDTHAYVTDHQRVLVKKINDRLERSQL